MEIGDKIEFNCYLPYDNNGNLKSYITIEDKRDISDYNIQPTINGLDLVFTGNRKMKVRPIDIIRDDKRNTTAYSTKILNLDKPKVGIVIGELYRKLNRKYRRDNLSSDERYERNRKLGFNGYWTTTHTNNPNRLDNPSQLDKIIIIATSKTKRWYVPYSRLKKSKLEIL